MSINSHGQIIVTIAELFNSVYDGRNPLLHLATISQNDNSEIIRYNNSVKNNGDSLQLLCNYAPFVGSTDQFDQIQTNIWFMPDTYKTLDIKQWLLDRCDSKEKLDRVVMELELFTKNNMLMVLRYLKYLVDTMRSNNVVWGVGRGSSVASYCLFLIGIHKIDSIQYDLDISEFFK